MTSSKLGDSSKASFPRLLSMDNRLLKMCLAQSKCSIHAGHYQGWFPGPECMQSPIHTILTYKWLLLALWGTHSFIETAGQRWGGYVSKDVPSILLKM